MIQFKKVEEKPDFVILHLYSDKERELILNRTQIESAYCMVDERRRGENKAACYTQINLIGDKYGFKVCEQVSDILKLIN